MKSERLIGLTAVLLLSSAVARADVEISKKPTSNMSCESGVCTATAQKAVLNVSDLATMLAGGDVAVKTGSLAKDIAIDQPFTWSNTSRLTLDAQQSITIKKQVTVAGQGALTVVTNDAGGTKAKNKNGEFVIVPEHGSVQFWDLGSSLIIDGNSYTLVGDIKTLASDIAANPNGFYALAKPYDASVDGTYNFAVVQTPVAGRVEGLGNPVANFQMRYGGGESALYGLFLEIAKGGTVRDFSLTAAKISGQGTPALVGALAGGNEGSVEYCSASGTLSASNGANVIGGLLSVNDGSVWRSFTAMKVDAQANELEAGGLVGANDARIEQSYSKGAISVSDGNAVSAGGLAGSNAGRIDNSFSLTSVRDGRHNCCTLQSGFGGLVGENEAGALIVSTYASGKISQSRNSKGTLLGGLIGYDAGENGAIRTSYWNLDKGVSDPAQGAGNILNDPGIVGLTTIQLQSSLPSGFNQSIWGQSANVNGGLPYLRALEK